MNKKYCVYRHIRNDNNKVFYIGIGNIKRPFSKEKRNNLWSKIVNKTTYTVDILYDNLSKEDAIELEIFLISLYGRIDLNQGTLSNLTDGGEGLRNYKVTEEFKIKHGLYNKGSLSRRKRTVYQYDLNENFIKEWDCIKVAEMYYNPNPKSKNITACCNHRQCSAYGFIWKHSKNNPSKKPKQYIKGTRVIDLTTNKIYESLKELSDELNINYNTFKSQFYSNKYLKYERI